jgi:Mrp family chromosome partitioning ATPase
VDFVLIDAPPTPMLHAAPALLDVVGASILVCRLNWTPTEALAQARETLETLGPPIAGLVVAGSIRRSGVPSGGGAAARARAGAVVELSPASGGSRETFARESRR